MNIDWRPATVAEAHRFSSVFSGKRLPENPFTHVGWRTVCLPYGVHIDRPTFEAIASAVGAMGDDLLIVKEVESLERLRPIVVPWSFDAFDRARMTSDTMLGILDTCWFGGSAEWGVVSACSLDDVAIIGGTTVFMERLVGGLGGNDRVKADFEQFARSEWRVDESVRRQFLHVSATGRFG